MPAFGPRHFVTCGTWPQTPDPRPQTPDPFSPLFVFSNIPGGTCIFTCQVTDPPPAQANPDLEFPDSSSTNPKSHAPIATNCLSFL
jgi:hypothetical protein